MKNDPNKNGMTYASHTLPSRVCVCEAYVIPFLFGSFFTVCHPYIDLHCVKCFLCYLYKLAVHVTVAFVGKCTIICDRICENPALPAIIDFALEAFIVTEVSFQQKRDYCMNGSTGP